MACSRPHLYTVEIVGELPRYRGGDPGAAVAALLSTGTDSECGGEGYAVAEHAGGDSTSYCRGESERIETAAIAVLAAMDREPVPPF